MSSVWMRVDLDFSIGEKIQFLRCTEDDWTDGVIESAEISRTRPIMYYISFDLGETGREAKDIRKIPDPDRLIRN